MDVVFSLPSWLFESVVGFSLAIGLRYNDEHQNLTVITDTPDSFPNLSPATNPFMFRELIFAEQHPLPPTVRGQVRF